MWRNSDFNDVLWYNGSQYDIMWYNIKSHGIKWRNVMWCNVVRGSYYFTNDIVWSNMAGVNNVIISDLV